MTEAEFRAVACCFTGHRSIPQSRLSSLRVTLTETVTRLAEKGYVYFITGGALGFDTLAAEAVLHLKQTTHPHLQLLLAIPCEGQERSWPKADQETYRRIRAAADRERVLSTHYFNGCMQMRNRYMVDHASVCVCYLTEDAGGTAGTVRYADKQGIAIHNLADFL